MRDPDFRVAAELLTLAQDLLVDRQRVVDNRRLDEHLPVVREERLGADARGAVPRAISGALATRAPRQIAQKFSEDLRR